MRIDINALTEALQVSGRYKSVKQSGNIITLDDGQCGWLVGGNGFISVQTKGLADAAQVAKGFEYLSILVAYCETESTPSNE